MVKEGEDFLVYDAKTGDDITRSVLAQIIFEQENKAGQNLLPTTFLRQLIRFYGDSMQAFLPSYLELSLDSFTRQQERMRGQVIGAVGAAPGVGFLEDQVRQNLVLFNRAMKMFSPFAFTPQPGDVPAEPVQAEPAPAKPAAPDTSLDDLKQRIEEMQTQIARLAAKE